MPEANELVGLIDVPGAERDALAEIIARDGLAVVAVEHHEQLPGDAVLVVAHARAVPSEAWGRWPSGCRPWWSATNVRTAICSRPWMRDWSTT